jgi:hypothetical protein
MNAGQIVGGTLAFILLELPLIILSWLLIKSTRVKFNRIRSGSYDNNKRKKDINIIIIFSIVITIIFILMVIPIIMLIVHDSILTLPLSLRLVLLISIFIIYPPIYACFMALFRGLGDVVGAGGSAYNVLSQLQAYLYEVLEIKKENNNDHAKT